METSNSKRIIKTEVVTISDESDMAVESPLVKRASKSSRNKNIKTSGTACKPDQKKNPKKSTLKRKSTRWSDSSPKPSTSSQPAEKKFRLANTTPKGSTGNLLLSTDKINSSQVAKEAGAKRKFTRWSPLPRSDKLSNSTYKRQINQESISNKVLKVSQTSSTLFPSNKLHTSPWSYVKKIKEENIRHEESSGNLMEGTFDSDKPVPAINRDKRVSVDKVFRTLKGKGSKKIPTRLDKDLQPLSKASTSFRSYEEVIKKEHILNEESSQDSIEESSDESYKAPISQNQKRTGKVSVTLKGKKDSQTWNTNGIVKSPTKRASKRTSTSSTLSESPAKKAKKNTQKQKNEEKKIVQRQANEEKKNALKQAREEKINASKRAKEEKINALKQAKEEKKIALKQAKEAKKNTAKKSKEKKTDNNNDDREIENRNIEKENVENNSQKGSHDLDEIIYLENDEEKLNHILNQSRTWTVEDMVSASTEINRRMAQNVISLFEQQCTIPFIARYRQEVTGGMEADKLREVQESYLNVIAVQKRIEKEAKMLAREKKLTLEIIKSLSNATTLSEIDDLCPCKKGGKNTLAKRARQLGLEEGASQIISGQKWVTQLNPLQLVDLTNKDLDDVSKILTGWQHIIAEMIYKDMEVIEFVKSFLKNSPLVIHSTQRRKAKKDEQLVSNQNNKFELYYNFKTEASNIKSYQVLALNRGENLKELSIKVIISPDIKSCILGFCNQKFGFKASDPETTKLINNSIEDAYNRLIEPFLQRQTRILLTRDAEKESIKVFCSNLKSLLLTPPTRGSTVLGIDPGFAHGCKLAVVSPQGEVLETKVLYLHGKWSTNCLENLDLKDIILRYNCSLIALGNGKGCRETELLLSNMISRQHFAPLNVSYCIVSENGVSIYSVTKEAQNEFPNLDPGLRSAVGLARRLQDPLLEYVKVEPKHLGVGQYQHDLSEQLLKNALDEVMIECVSFVGADLNVSNETVLKKVAGLNSATARNIIDWRETKGSFKNRTQLLTVKGIGAKSFEQCAGFVKIMPETCLNTIEPLPDTVPTKIKKTPIPVETTFNPLDMTTIHPESYKIAEKFLEYLKVDPSQIGKTELIAKVKDCLRRSSMARLSDIFEAPESTMRIIIEAFSKSNDYDLRHGRSKPLFRQGVMVLADLYQGQKLSGQINNVTQFGAFVDIGVEVNGLIGMGQMYGFKLSVGDRVEVIVLHVDIERKRIGLKPIKIG